eukprot:3236381-Pleurochrysis_carterae.AAC.2
MQQQQTHVPPARPSNDRASSQPSASTCNAPPSGATAPATSDQTVIRPLRNDAHGPRREFVRIPKYP